MATPNTKPVPASPTLIADAQALMAEVFLNANEVVPYALMSSHHSIRVLGSVGSSATGDNV